MIKTLRKRIDRLPPIVRNQYLLTGLAFLVWMTFFDQHDWISQLERKQEWKRMEDKKAFYQSEIAKVEETKSELFTDAASLERFARERYFMKKENEDIIVIVPPRN